MTTQNGYSARASAEQLEPTGRWREYFVVVRLADAAARDIQPCQSPAGKALPGPPGLHDLTICDARNVTHYWVTRAREVGPVEGSLYDRLGGVDAITAVARAFEDRAGKDGRINQKFARTNLDRLTKEFVDQLCQDTGGHRRQLAVHQSQHRAGGITPPATVARSARGHQPSGKRRNGQPVTGPEPGRDVAAPARPGGSDGPVAFGRPDPHIRGSS
jgi:hypothetical protein